MASIFAPIFFVSVGASVNLRLLDPDLATAARGMLGIAAALIAIAVVGKIAAGWAAPWLPMRRLVVGVGMVPRGEVGLIFADIGRRSGVLNERGVRRGAAHGHGDDLRGASRRSRPSSAGTAAEPTR